MLAASRVAHFGAGMLATDGGRAALAGWAGSVAGRVDGVLRRVRRGCARRVGRLGGRDARARRPGARDGPGGRPDDRRRRPASSASGRPAVHVRRGPDADRRSRRGRAGRGRARRLSPRPGPAGCSGSRHKSAARLPGSGDAASRSARRPSLPSSVSGYCSPPPEHATTSASVDGDGGELGVFRGGRPATKRVRRAVPRERSARAVAPSRYRSIRWSFAAIAAKSARASPVPVSSQAGFSVSSTAAA